MQKAQCFFPFIGYLSVSAYIRQDECNRALTHSRRGGLSGTVQRIYKQPRTAYGPNPIHRFCREVKSVEVQIRRGRCP